MKLFGAPVLRAVFLVTCAVFIRFWGDIFSNQPWGEEATDFFIDAVWRQVTPFTPVASTLFFLERIITSIGVMVSVTQAPMVVHLICTLIYIAVCSSFSVSSFRWFIPSDNLRALLCLLVALGPGSPEVIANLPCLPYVIGWGLALSLCAESRSNVSSVSSMGQDGRQAVISGAGATNNLIRQLLTQLRELPKVVWRHRGFSLLWLVGTASSHISAVLAPLSALRWWHTRDAKYLWSLGCSLACFIIHIILAQYSKLEITTPALNPLPLTLTVLIGNIFSTSVLSVLTGLPSITLWEMSRPLVYVGCTLLSLVAGWSIFRSSDKASSAVSLGLVLSIIFMFCVHAIARGNYLKHEIGYPAFHLSMRHFWLPYCSCLLVLVGHCLYRFRLINLRFGLLGVVCSALLSVIWSWDLNKQQHMEDWALFYNQVMQGKEYVNLGISESLDSQALPKIRLYVSGRGPEMVVGLERYQDKKWWYQPGGKGDAAFGVVQTDVKD